MLSFIGRRHDFGAHLNECENCEFLCRPETRRSPLRELPLLNRINRVCRFVGFSWKLARMFVRYQLTQSMWSFYEIRSISLVTCRSVTVTEIIFIVKLQNRFSQAPIEISKKNLTHSVSLLNTEWYHSVLSDVRGNTEACNSVKHTPSVLCLRSSIGFFDRARSGCEHSAISIRSHDCYPKRCVEISLTQYRFYVMESRVFSNCARNIHRPSTPEKEVNEMKTPWERLAKGDRSRQIRKFIDLSEVLFQHVMFRDKKSEDFSSHIYRVSFSRIS